MLKCHRCGLPAFDGPASYSGPQCKCWATYHPAPNAAAQPGACTPPRFMTEEDVRRIVREMLGKQG